MARTRPGSVGAHRVSRSGTFRRDVLFTDKCSVLFTALDSTQWAENVGDTTIHLILVELKK